MASTAGGRKVIGDTLGPKVIRFVHSAQSARETQVSMQSRWYSPITLKKWSLRQSDSKPRSSTTWQRLRQRSQVSPSWPSIITPITAISI